MGYRNICDASQIRRQVARQDPPRESDNLQSEKEGGLSVPPESTVIDEIGWTWVWRVAAAAGDQLVVGCVS